MPAVWSFGIVLGMFHRIVSRNRIGKVNFDTVFRSGSRRKAG